MEDSGDKYIHKLSQFVSTMNSRENRTTTLIPKKVKNNNFLRILYNRPIRNKKKPKKRGRFCKDFTQRYSFQERIQITVYKRNLQNH